MLFSTYAKGKLLLTGEYFVLDGAKALATPVRFGQNLVATETEDKGVLEWVSLDEQAAAWFQARISLPDFKIAETSDAGVAATLQMMIQACKGQNPDFLNADKGLRVVTSLDFPRAWGLGTSSTLIAALAAWAGVDPYKVLSATLGGSGYDLACAYAKGPLIYYLDGGAPHIESVSFAPSFADRLYFVYLGKKQNSREGIQRYRERGGDKARLIPRISALTDRMLQAGSLSVFEDIIREHEHILSDTLGLTRTKDLYFRDYPGEIKSLGAWGGDFVLATSTAPVSEVKNYFAEKGCDVCLSYGEMIAPVLEG